MCLNRAISGGDNRTKFVSAAGRGQTEAAAGSRDLTRAQDPGNRRCRRGATEEVALLSPPPPLQAGE